MTQRGGKLFTQTMVNNQTDTKIQPFANRPPVIYRRLAVLKTRHTRSFLSKPERTKRLSTLQVRLIDPPQLFTLGLRASRGWIVGHFSVRQRQSGLSRKCIQIRILVPSNAMENKISLPAFRQCRLRQGKLESDFVPRTHHHHFVVPLTNQIGAIAETRKHPGQWWPTSSKICLLIIVSLRLG